MSVAQPSPAPRPGAGPIDPGVDAGVDPAAIPADPTAAEVWDDSGLSDGELLDLCRAGDQQSWTALVGRYSRLVITVATKAGLDHEDARDVAQATFVALLESGTRIRHGERLSSWLITVAQRKAWRARQRLDREQTTETVPDAAEDPQETWERVAVLQSALAELGQPCRDLLIALYLDPTSPSYVEIAQRLGRAVGTIGPTRGRCLAKLRALIGEDVW